MCDSFFQFFDVRDDYLEMHSAVECGVVCGVDPFAVFVEKDLPPVVTNKESKTVFSCQDVVAMILVFLISLVFEESDEGVRNGDEGVELRLVVVKCTLLFDKCYRVANMFIGFVLLHFRWFVTSNKGE